MDELNFILTGPKGSGKSATGNSVLGRKEFNPLGDFFPGSTEILRGESARNGKTVLVVDAYVVGEWGERYKLSLRERARRVVRMCKYRVTAFIFVYPFITGFKSDIEECIKEIRSNFGENVLKTNGIIVLSHGDYFEEKVEYGILNFQDWCDVQTGDLMPLFEECGSRVVLFDNRTKDPEKKEQQFKRLMEKVDEINQVFRATNFQDAALTCTGSQRRPTEEKKSLTGFLRFVGKRILNSLQLAARMGSPVVKTVLEMGFPESVVKTAMERKVADDGGLFSNAEELMDAVFALNEGEKSEELRNTTEDEEDEGLACAAGSHSNEHNRICTHDTLKLIEENRCLKEQRLCKICLDEDVSVTFQPCGHLVCCDTCAPALNACPICRAEIAGTVRTYLS